MAQNGSRSPQTCSSPSLPYSSATPPPRPPGPRVHRPRLAIMTPPPPTTITLQPLGGSAMSSRRPIVIQQPVQQSAEVTLTAPRPDNDRTVNEYVETPFRPPDVHFASKSKQVKSSDLVRGLESRLSSSSTSSEDRTRNLVRRDPHHQTLHLPIGQHPNKSRAQRVVTKQPGASASATFKKDLPGSSLGALGRGEGASGTNADCFRGSIICPECGRCRCDSCRQPRPLPSRWLCNEACFCSADTGLDYASCLCCVKGLFYHCSKDYELDRDGDGSCADDPCSCASHRIYTRWGCLSLLALALPCLLCYWPLKGCVALCENCYSRYANQGCRCEPRDPKITDLTPEKRLLDTSPDF